MLFQLNHMTIFLGYYLSPCNLWTIHDEKNFISVCQLLSTLQLGTGIAAFLWVFRRALYFQMKAAKVKKYVLSKYFHFWFMITFSTHTTSSSMYFFNSDRISLRGLKLSGQSLSSAETRPPVRNRENQSYQLLMMSTLTGHSC